MIAEAIFNCLLRYGVAVFLKPVYDEEDLNRRKLPQNTNVLQTLQNSMIRVIYGLKIRNHVNMKNVREKNQDIECYSRLWNKRSPLNKRSPWNIWQKQ